MTIDAHQHFWYYSPVRDRWIDDSMTVIRKDFLPKDLKPILEANGVGDCVAVQADQSEEETKFLLKCAEENPFVKAVVGWVDLCADNVEVQLEYFSKNKLFKGVRHIIQAENETFVLKPDFQNGISKLAQFGLVFDVLVFPNHLENIIKLVQKFPKQQFVLNHIAKPKMSETLDEAWVKNIQILATFKNVSCKISGLVTETENFEWQETMFKPFLDVVVDAFGVDRLLFGSDWPVCLLAAEYQDVLQIVKNYFINFSKADQEKVMGENAINIYNIKR
ncbi:amidohydrolase family protein [Mariniflexile litorale]|uniref:Amidohydrolase family protein n=1 Tax=Mariniflexile litorale TaxID=3045158 RepID=A0AAU7EBQ6_9FLAO|nr:amidohydrolase family protein [Mariniflexile sp. KMM 9835]MDQ8213075.1 amidohydrolase family protein [Mariniflexile sp. KMM 9835]